MGWAVGPNVICLGGQDIPYSITLLGNLKPGYALKAPVLPVTTPPDATYFFRAPLTSARSAVAVGAAWRILTLKS